MLEHLIAGVASTGWLAPILFSLLYIAAVVLVLPGSVLTISGGLLFGPIWGTAINLLSATAGAILSFLLARSLGRGFVQKIIRGRATLEGLDRHLERGGFYPVLYLRLVPLFPFNLLNYSLGLTRVRLRDYALASLVGMLPGSFVYTSLGAAGRHISLIDPKCWLDVHVWGPFALVIVLTSLPKILERFRKFD